MGGVKEAEGHGHRSLESQKGMWQGKRLAGGHGASGVTAYGDPSWGQLMEELRAQKSSQVCCCWYPLGRLGSASCLGSNVGVYYSGPPTPQGGPPSCAYGVEELTIWHLYPFPAHLSYVLTICLLGLPTLFPVFLPHWSQRPRPLQA